VDRVQDSGYSASAANVIFSGQIRGAQQRFIKPTSWFIYLVRDIIYVNNLVQNNIYINKLINFIDFMIKLLYKKIEKN